MNNTINNYQPDDEVFLNIFLAVLFFILSLFYSVYEINQHGGLLWYDRAILGATVLAVVHLCVKVRRRA